MSLLTHKMAYIQGFRLSGKGGGFGQPGINEQEQKLLKNKQLLYWIDLLKKEEPATRLYPCRPQPVRPFKSYASI